MRQVLIDLGTAMEYFPGEKREAWGTVGFAPPEIGGICEQPPSMDLFAIVSTLAALLGVDVERQAIGAPLHAEWPVSSEIYDFVMRGRDPDPRVRFQTVTEVFDQLEGIARFIQGQERARLAGRGSMGGVSSGILAGASRARAEHDHHGQAVVGDIGHDGQDQRVAGVERGRPRGAVAAGGARPDVGGALP